MCVGLSIPLDSPTAKETQMDNKTKEKITSIVQHYKRVYRDEFISFSSSLKRNIAANNDLYGTVSKGNDFVERKIVELPENLFIMLKSGLSDIEYLWLFPENNPKNEGIKWFAKTFVDFRASKEV